MTLLAFYAAFSLATSISMWYDFFNPVLQDAIASGIKNPVTESPKLSALVYVVIHIVIAPVAIFVIAIPALGTQYISGLSREIYRND